MEELRRGQERLRALEDERTRVHETVLGIVGASLLHRNCRALHRLLGRLGGRPQVGEAEALAELGSKVGRLHELVHQGPTPQSYFTMEAQRLARAVRDAIKDVTQPSPNPPEQEPPWVRRVRDVLVMPDENLSDMRLEAQFGPVVA